VDDVGLVVDFLAWGYSEQEIASLDLTIGGHRVGGDGGPVEEHLAVIGNNDGSRRSGVTTFLQSEGFAVSQFATPPASFDEFTTVILLRQFDVPGTTAGTPALADWVRSGGRVITEWNASEWALNVEHLLDADDVLGPDFGGVSLPSSFVTFSQSGVQKGLADGIGSAYSDPGRTDFFRNFGNLGGSVDVLATRPNAEPAILGGTAGVGSVLVIGYDWSDNFASSSASTKQLLRNAIQARPISDPTGAKVAWSGDGVPVNTTSASVQRGGSSDNEAAADFAWLTDTKGAVNDGLLVPFTGNLPQDAPTILITEVGDGTPDFVEIQNVLDRPVDTAGWVLAVGGGADINFVNDTLWSFPASIAAGEVLVRTDQVGNNYWGNDIAWDAGGSGWAMIVDDAGAVVDFAAWGYSESEIATMDVRINGLRIGEGRQPTKIAVVGNNDTSRRSGVASVLAAEGFT
ncbi:MAG: lamin tail domain-containing protein, partial [Pirellulales bacterium]